MWRASHSARVGSAWDRALRGACTSSSGSTAPAAPLARPNWGLVRMLALQSCCPGGAFIFGTLIITASTQNNAKCGWRANAF